MGKAIFLDQIIKAIKNLCILYIEISYRNIYRNNLRETPEKAFKILYYNNLIQLFNLVIYFNYLI